MDLVCREAQGLDAPQASGLLPPGFPGLRCQGVAAYWVRSCPNSGYLAWLSAHGWLDVSGIAVICGLDISRGSSDLWPVHPVAAAAAHAVPGKCRTPGCCLVQLARRFRLTTCCYDITNTVPLGMQRRSVRLLRYLAGQSDQCPLRCAGGMSQRQALPRTYFDQPAPQM